MGNAICGKESRKGRAIGGMVMGIKRDLVERGLEIEIGREGVIVRRIGLKEG